MTPAPGWLPKRRQNPTLQIHKAKNPREGEGGEADIEKPPSGIHGDRPFEGAIEKESPASTLGKRERLPPPNEAKETSKHNRTAGPPLGIRRAESHRAFETFAGGVAGRKGDVP